MRIAGDPSKVRASIQGSVALHSDIRAIQAEVARSGHRPELVSGLGDSLAEVVALNQARIEAGLDARGAPRRPEVDRRTGSVGRRRRGAARHRASGRMA